MSAIDPVHFLFGYVEIKCENGFAERFINLCTAESIPLWDLHKSGDKITAKTTINGYKKIRSPARESSMKVRLLKKRGLPFAVGRFLRRPGLLIGFALMILTLSILSGRIWIIEIDNETSIPDRKILSAYADAGLTIGCSKKLNTNNLKSDADTALKDVSWTTVNIIGSTATIKVREVKKPLPIDSGKGVSNIVALKDGQVEIIEPYRGSPAVSAGQTVREGDLLVSGVTENRLQGYIYSDAEGYVVANTEIRVRKDFSDKITILKPKTKKVYSIYFLGKELPLGVKKSCDVVYNNRKRLCVGGKIMPFGICYDLLTDFEEEASVLSEKDALLSALNDYSLAAYHETLHTQSISKEITVTQEQSTVSIHGAYRCYENITSKVPLETDNTDAQ